MPSPSSGMLTAVFRDLLVHVTADEAGERRVTYALDLASQLDARLTGVHVLTEPDVPPVFKPSRVAEAAARLAKREKSAAERAETLFRRVVKGRKPPTRWIGLSGHMAAKVCECARYTDVVIVGHEPTEVSAERDPRSLSEIIVQSCGRPVIVLAEDLLAARLPQRILLAWDGSREAVRAVHDALPLLRSADLTVALVANAEDRHLATDVAKGGDLADHLGRHGVKISHAETRTFPHDEVKAVFDYLASSEFDLLVMGAYSHSAWREFLFGGMTSSAIQSARLPVFFSH